MSSYHIVPDTPLAGTAHTSANAPESRYDAEVRLLIAAVLESRRAYRLAVSLAKDVMLSSHGDVKAASHAPRIHPTPIRFSALVPPSRSATVSGSPESTTSRTSASPLRLVRVGEMATVTHIDTSNDGGRRA